MHFAKSKLLINQNLSLTEYKINLEATVPVKQTVNHIWIFDRSGSMYGLLNELVEDLIKRARLVPIGDTLTLGWFSSEGQKNFILKGFKVNEVTDYTILEKAIRQNNTTIGCTCFSEILAETEHAIKDLSVFSNKFSFCFFTDGFPVVSNYEKEIKAIYKAITVLSNQVTSALLVGYGSYYNKPLMSEMAEKIGGTLIHSEDLSTFATSLEELILNSEGTNRFPFKIEEKVTSDTIIFSLEDWNITLYSADENNEVKLATSKDEAFVYVLEVSKEDLEGFVAPAKEIPYSQALYAAAYILTQRTKTDLAIDVLGYLGDKYLIDLVVNSFTNPEYSKAEEEIKSAVSKKTSRYKSGKVRNYVPPKDAFCLLDLVDLLSEDKEAFFYPRNKFFKYNRIGKPAVIDPKYPKFKADESSRSPFSDVVWNETKLNLSIRAVLQGTIELPDEHRKYGLVKEFPTYQFRNYTFVKDGLLNSPRVPVSLSKASFDVLEKKQVIWDSEWAQDKIFILQLSSLPVVNRKIAEANTSATDLCKSLLREIEIKATLKALKYYKDKDFPEKEVTAETAKTFMEKQQAFLEEVGVNTKSGAFQPPVTSVESDDFYMAKEFAIKVKGCSSFPKIEVVASKISENKKLTTSDLLVAKGITLYENGPKKLDWFVDNIKSLNEELKKVRRKIQETKFSILLGKMWFDDFSSREDNKLVVDGYEFTFCLNEKKVAI